jgi:hypothetical protein
MGGRLRKTFGPFWGSLGLFPKVRKEVQRERHGQHAVGGRRPEAWVGEIVADMGMTFLGKWSDGVME